MKYLEYLKSKEKRAIWMRAFHIWQRRPFEVAPLKQESHVCSSCKTEYTGNYCPRCGQAAGVGRFSFKKALMLFLDVWAIGNRSMLRSLRDLMFRPGFMIRDYLRGMQSAYFPPFKMFFLLAAFSLIAKYGIDLGLSGNKNSGSNKQTTAAPADTLKSDSTRVEKATAILTDVLKGDSTSDKQATAVLKDSLKGDSANAKQATAVLTDSLKSDSANAKQATAVLTDSQKGDSAHAKPTAADDFLKKTIEVTDELQELSKNNNKEAPLVKGFVIFIVALVKLWDSNPTIFALLTLMLFSLPLYLFIRRSPYIPDMRYSEFTVALVYTSNVYSIYSIIGSLLGSFIIQLIAVLMVFVTLKQFSGISKKRLLGYITLSVLIVTIVLVALFTLTIYILYWSVT